MSDKAFRFLLWLPALALMGIFVALNWGVLSRGYGALDPSFWVTPPSKAGRLGGISSIAISTLAILGVCLATAVPISLGAAILLSEYAPRGTRAGSAIGLSLDVLAGVPSIVFGLFGNVVFCKILGLGFSILAGGLTLACMVFPILIRSVEESLRSVPDDYRFGAEALALSRTTAIFGILLPAALPGLLVGVVLGIGRALGETAALIFTSGYVDRMPESVLDSGRALSVHIYDLAMNVPGGEPNAYRSAFALLLIVLALNSAVAFLGKRWLRQGIGLR